MMNFEIWEGILIRFPGFPQLTPNWPNQGNDSHNSEALLACFLRPGALTWAALWLLHCMLHQERADALWLQLGLFSKLKANADQLHPAMISFV